MSGDQDLNVRIRAALFACLRARARGDEHAADQHWKEYISLLIAQEPRLANVRSQPVPSDSRLLEEGR